MAHEESGGFLLTDVEAVNLFLFVDVVLQSIGSVNEFAKKFSIGKDSVSIMEAAVVSLNANKLVTSPEVVSYLEKLDHQMENIVHESANSARAFAKEIEIEEVDFKC